MTTMTTYTFQFYVILNGIKTIILMIWNIYMFQFYVILNGIKTTNTFRSGADSFQFYVILNGIKTKRNQFYIKEGFSSMSF